MTLGKRIIQLRKKQNMSQEKLANILKVSRGAVSMWEIGQRRPDLDTLQKLADFFGCSVDYLLGRTNVRETPKQKIKDDPKMTQSYLNFGKS